MVIDLRSGVWAHLLSLWSVLGSFSHCTAGTQVPSVPCFSKESKMMAVPLVTALGKRLVSPGQHLQEPGVVTAAPRLSGLCLC